MKALVTGGSGFLGSAIVRRLQARGDTVRVLARGDYPELGDVELQRGDIRDAAATAKACAGMDVVFHTAAKVGGWGDRKEFEAINVEGTAHVLAGCKAGGVPCLVHTSTPSVVHADHDLEGADESIAYGTHFTADYPRTKAIAERLVRAAEGVATICLRPHFIWGPGDPHLLPRLVVRARAGKMRQVGTRDVKTDWIFIDNCVDAHLLAAEKLRAGAPLGGRAYFISDGAPIGIWTMANRMLEAAGAPKVGKPVPAWLAYGLGATLEAAHAVFGIDREPMMTRFAATEMSHSKWFDISAARRDLGYAPKVSNDEGIARLAAWCRQSAKTT